MLADEDILLKLRAFEDAFVERKSKGDHADWIKTIVAFANSTPVGFPAVLFIGVRDNGEPEGDVNLDSLQKKLSEKVALVYPQPYYATRVLSLQDKQFLAVIVPGSADKPHFGGPSYIRSGSKSIVASEEQFKALIASRQSKVREIMKWKDKLVTLDRMNSADAVHMLGAVASTQECLVADCNEFYLTIRYAGSSGLDSVPLRRTELSFDNAKGRLKIELYQV